MTESSTLNFQYPCMHAITSYIVAKSVSDMLKIAYTSQSTAQPRPLVEWVSAMFESYPFEVGADDDVRLQIMRELEFIGFAW